MTFRSRLTNGLQKLGVIDSPRANFDKRVPSLDLNQMKNAIQFTEMAGLSQPVWGPEISTVGAFSREGYTSRTFDTPEVPFRTQVVGLQQDEDTQLAINHLSAQVTGGAHYIKAEQTFVADYFKRFTEDLHFDTFDTEVAKELKVATKTITRWERAGKIRRAKRDWRGWRVYSPEELVELKKILETVY